MSKVRQQGYATDRGEGTEGINCVAAPIFGADGEVLAAICISGPAHRLSPSSFRRLGRLAIDAADMVTQRLKTP